MMQLLARTPGEPVTREALAGAGSLASNERTIDVQINRLRRKIEEDPAEPRYLQTARGAGYRLVVDR
jgi:two-component system phosphate regulon response regulator OmpR